MYSNNTGCEFWCIALDGETLSNDDCVEMEPGCRCQPGTFRDETGACVPMTDCGCITQPNGEVKEVRCHSHDIHKQNSMNLTQIYSIS